MSAKDRAVFKDGETRASDMIMVKSRDGLRSYQFPASPGGVVGDLIRDLISEIKALEAALMVPPDAKTEAYLVQQTVMVKTPLFPNGAPSLITEIWIPEPGDTAESFKVRGCDVVELIRKERAK